MVAGLAMAASAVNRNDGDGKQKGIDLGVMHDYPPSPFESRQVRRARERRLAKLNKSK